jgi:hypothetical protein
MHDHGPRILARIRTGAVGFLSISGGFVVTNSRTGLFLL